MDRRRFELEVEIFFDLRPCGNARSAKDALLALYDYMVLRAKESDKLPKYNERWSECVFQVEQACTWSPLRLFWQVLSHDEHLVIRAAARSNLRKAFRQYWDDHDIGMVGHAGVSVILASSSARLKDEMVNDPLFRKAVEQWEIATEGASFTPVLRITVFDEKNKPSNKKIS